MSIAENSNREPPSKRKEKLDGQDRKPKPHEVGLQVPRRVYTERAKESVVWPVEEAPRGGVPWTGTAQGKPD